MKITNVSLDCYVWPHPKPIRNGKYTYVNNGINVVRVVTDQGITGLGLGFLGTGSTPAGVQILRGLVEEFRPALVGEDPLDVEKIWANMWVPKLVGRRGLSTRVISAIDIALWDIKGKLCNLPMYKLLGGYTNKIPAYIAGGFYEEGKGLKELAQEMEQNVAMGTRAVKIKIGGVSINEDVERIRVVRETIGSEVKLLVDANNAYRYYEAIEIARKIEKYDIFWFEEPVMPDDYRGHAMVAAATIIPIATGENEYTRYGFRDLIERKAVSILNADAQLMGGVTEFMKVAALAAAYDLPMAPHGNQDVHVHLVAAIPNGLIVEYYRGTINPMWDKMFKEQLIFKDGYLEPPDRPGFGIELNEEALGPYKVG
ncbi:mandelate racemase/muconate lactonizing enzyme family protein [Chloroflexota bacterium]